MTLPEFKRSTYSLRRSYNTPIRTIQKVPNTTLVIVNGDQLLAPYGFHGHIQDDELYKGDFSNRVKKLTRKELEALQQLGLSTTTQQRENK